MNLFYCFKGGCGADILQGKIEKETFSLSYSSNWMGKDALKIDAEGVGAGRTR